MPPWRHRGLRIDPIRARPVPFCFHGFRPPPLTSSRRKVDAVPGYTTYTWFKALRANELYHGQCAQLCGTNHAAMVAYVRVVSPQKYETWLGHQEAEITTQNDQVQQLRQILTSENQLGN